MLRKEMLSVILAYIIPQSLRRIHNEPAVYLGLRNIQEYLSFYLVIQNMRIMFPSFLPLAFADAESVFIFFANSVLYSSLQNSQ